MNSDEQIRHILQKQDGIITTADALQHNISKPVFLDNVRKMGLEKLAHGIYASKDAWPDFFRLFQMQYTNIVFSHESALYLHGFAEREPMPVSITVKRGYHSLGMEKYDVKLYYVSLDKLTIGLAEKVSPSGYMVRCYNMERTLCDLLRSRSTVDYQELTNAFKTYARSKGKNIPLLMRYGEVFRVTKKLKSYLEVLL